MTESNLTLKSSYTGVEGHRHETWVDNSGNLFTRGPDGKLTRSTLPDGMTIIANVNAGELVERILQDQSGAFFYQVGGDPPEAITADAADAIRSGWYSPRRRPVHRM